MVQLEDKPAVWLTPDAPLPTAGEGRGGLGWPRLSGTRTPLESGHKHQAAETPLPLSLSPGHSSASSSGRKVLCKKEAQKQDAIYYILRPLVT